MIMVILPNVDGQINVLSNSGVAKLNKLAGHNLGLFILTYNEPIHLYGLSFLSGRAWALPSPLLVI